MKSNRMREFVCGLEGRRGKWRKIGIQGVACLGIVCFLVACSASNPSREALSELRSPNPDSMPTGVGEEANNSLSPAFAGSIAQMDDYQIGPFDLLEIDVFQVPELSHAVRVNSQGSISLPLLGPVQVSGLTSQQLEVYLAKLLEQKYLQDPQVSVFIEEYANQRVTVGGGVQQPGIYPIKGRTTLLQAIAEARGAKFEAARGQGSVKIFHMTDTGPKEVSSYSLNALYKGKIPDPEIRNDDIVMVEESRIKIFFTQFFRFFMNPLALF